MKFCTRTRGEACGCAAVILITHDLGVIAEVTDRVLVLYGGLVMETEPVRDLFARPAHPYTVGLLGACIWARSPSSRRAPISITAHRTPMRALLSAIPVPDPTAARASEPMQEEIPTAINIPSGCRFRTRCPLAVELCARGRAAAARAWQRTRVRLPFCRRASRTSQPPGATTGENAMNKLALPLMTGALLASTGGVWAAGELTYVVNNESAQYDPGTTAETFAAPIGNTFEGLVRLSHEGEVVPALAE